MMSQEDYAEIAMIIEFHTNNLGEIHRNILAMQLADYFEKTSDIEHVWRNHKRYGIKKFNRKRFLESCGVEL